MALREVVWVLGVPGGIVVGFAGLFVVMVGCALVTPAAVFGLLGRLATRSIVAALLRPPLALERLTESSHGQLLYALAHPRSDGARHVGAGRAARRDRLLAGAAGRGRVSDAP